MLNHIDYAKGLKLNFFVGLNLQPIRLFHPLAHRFNVQKIVKNFYVLHKKRKLDVDLFYNYTFNVK